MNILVTGGAGYIGSVAVEELISAGFKVIVVDNLSIGRKSHIPDSVPLYRENIGNTAAMKKVLSENNIDVVMHFAAFALVGESVENPDMYFQNNVIETLNLLHAMKETGCKDIIFSSTCAVYGIPSQIPISETHAINPINPYGLSKRIIEQSMEWFSKAYGFRYNIFRYFNAAGASELRGEDRDVETHIIPLLLQTAFGKRPFFTVFGTDYNTKDGSCVRDYIHVKDIAAAHILGIDNLKEHPAAIYNLGTGTGYSNIEVINKVMEISGVDFEVRMGSRRPGDPDELIGGHKKANRELKWFPQHSDLTNIVETAYRFAKAQSNTSTSSL